MPGGLPLIPTPQSCPKCGGNDMRLVDRLETGGGYGGMTFLAVKWGPFLSTGRFGAFICRKCGFTELYLSDPEDLDRT